jgi:hypothetical protein
MLLSGQKSDLLLLCISRNKDKIRLIQRIKEHRKMSKEIFVTISYRCYKNKRNG